jgi:4-hydroxy-tetrahydrodipicolinate reductase
MKTAIAVNAATGKMGQQIIDEAIDHTAIDLTAAFCRSAHPFYNKTVRRSSNTSYSNDIDKGLSESQVVIDFSLPSVTVALLERAVLAKTPLLIGTTGFTEQQLTLIDSASQVIPILLAPNTSIGVNATLSLLSKAASLIGKESNIEIIESHHKNKLDAPSGTAIKMGNVIADTLGLDFSERSVYDRSETNTPRSESEIGVSVVRAGSIVGEHKVLFALENEIISIEHKAQNRKCFAEGAVKAAIWLAKQNSGLYSMKDFID